MASKRSLATIKGWVTRRRNARLRGEVISKKKKVIKGKVFRRRSAAAIKGWVTRRQNVRIAELEHTLKERTEELKQEKILRAGEESLREFSKATQDLVLTTTSQISQYMARKMNEAHREGIDLFVDSLVKETLEEYLEEYPYLTLKNIYDIWYYGIM